MNRDSFIKSLMLLSLTPTTMKLHALNRLADSLDTMEQMPVFFLGHGSPMNAIEENNFVKEFRKLGSELLAPRAILCISAHWETNGTFVTAMERPRTIHDFGGFPEELYGIQYPAPGSPKLAQETKDLIRNTEVGLDNKWGLDHGSWTVIKHLYPNADVPIIQMSLDYTKPAKFHYDLAKELMSLRNKGILIVGSGNLVHNLSMINWSKLSSPYAYDWAEEASEKMKSYILNGEHHELINYQNHGKAFNLAIPTPEHYLPLLYVMALKSKKDDITLFNDEPIGGSITMTSVKVVS